MLKTEQKALLLRKVNVARHVSYAYKTAVPSEVTLYTGRTPEAEDVQLHQSLFQCRLLTQQYPELCWELPGPSLSGCHFGLQ